ncbi:MAG: efflux transporter periplasmic adaptor subunit [Rhodospirillales bacterium 70-18]|nr:MAG: efflux transporter periplasmic adaptor subunit [Rhodospirillales bacterium 70-18]
MRASLVLLFLALVGGGLVAFHQFKSGIISQVVAGIQAQRPTVATATATSQPWQAELVASGTLRAARGADLAAEVAGIVDQVHIDSGTDVAAGTVLLTLRSAEDTAKLAQLQAAADLAATTYARDVKQLRAQAVSQATVDADLAALRGDQAQVAAQRALIDQKTVRAPFAGRLGIRQVDVGQFLAAGTSIVTLQALDPIDLDVYAPQSAIGAVRVGQHVQVRTDSASGADFTGTVSAIDAKTDAASRMTQLRISLRNPDKRLLPGMFATATIGIGAPVARVTVPATAISFNPYGSLVYVVHDDGTDADGKPKHAVRQQFVTTGDTRGDQVTVLKGLSAGDQVVVAGQLKLRNDIPVLIDNSVRPSDDAAPTPADE